MKVWLYLAQPWMAKTWIEGGQVPLTVVSTYRTSERSGIYTPDEVKQMDFSLDPSKFINMGGNFKVTNCTVFAGPNNSGRLDGRQWEEDGLVLCLTHKEPHWDHMQRFGKQCCVRIEDVHALKEALDRQVGAISEMRACEYTRNRAKLNHFLKGEQDAWQAEYRLFWKDQPNQNVTLPPGVASAVRLWKGMWHTGTFFR